MNRFWAWSLGMLLFWTVPVHAQSLAPTPRLTQSEILQSLRKANVIYLGEIHDRLEDHQAQLEIIRQLHQTNPRIAIGMEMVQRPFQSVLDRYRAGEITEAELREQIQYDKRWGFPWELYAPIFRYAKENGLPLIALNTPAEVSRKVARQGLEELTDEERQHIPPFSEIRTDNPDYRRLIQSTYESFHQGKGNSEKFERFFLAQVLWDETMADRIVRFLENQPDYQMVVLAGRGHIIYGYGIPDRVLRRMGQGLSGRPFTQRSLLLTAPQDLPPAPAPAADYFWTTD